MLETHGLQLGAFVAMFVLQSLSSKERTIYYRSGLHAFVSPAASILHCFGSLLTVLSVMLSILESQLFILVVSSLMC